MFCHHNSMTVEKLNSGKIIVLSPQSGDIGKLAERKEIILKKKIKVNSKNPAWQLTCRVYGLHLDGGLDRLLGC